MLYVMPFLVAMIVTIAWLPLFGKFATKWGIIDAPGHRKVHTTPIPRIGGVAMAVGVLIAAIIVVPLDARDRYFMIGAGAVALCGMLDDRYDLDYRIKALGQVVAAAIVVIGGDIQIRALTLDDRILLPHWISVPLSMLFVVGITNAINLADGLDGLAGGTTFLSLCALAILAYGAGEPSCAALALAFAGAVLGFLRFNTFPASIFMGDAGSQLLGFAVGVLSLRATEGGDGDIGIGTPILLLALPILDTLSVMIQRISEGRSPFSADKNHIHHKLLAFGFDHHEAVMVIYAIQAGLFLLAYWLRFESDLTILGAIAVFFLGSITLLQAAARQRWRLRSAQAYRRESALTRLVTVLRQPRYLPRWSYLAISVGVGAYATLVAIQSLDVSGDVRWLLTGMLTIVLAWLALLRTKPLSTVEKGALYITATILVYLDHSRNYTDSLMNKAVWASILLMAAGTLLRMRLASDRRFALSPLDLIVLFVALVVPSLPSSLGLPDGGALGIAKLVVLFYAVEALLNRSEPHVLWVRVVASVLLAGLVVRVTL
jgi:UDP-GlcNAc:undecaprenyl-phosphate GlcNAc-1-phosphate transferase